jgi:hypothetical protein
VLSRAIYPKRKGRKPFAALAILSILSGLLITSGTVLAVHEEDFQLDGDIASATTTTIGGDLQTIDWDAIFDANGAAVDPLPAGFSDPGFKKDFSHSTLTGGSFITSDGSTYATGSKDTLPISGWQCNLDNNVNSKIDVMNAYTVAYEDASGDELLYFALERNVNTGTANVGFWFLQDAVGCESTGAAVTFSGEHKDGDVLVVSEFSNGGVVSTIQVYRWDRNNGHADCDDDPEPGPLCVINPVGVPGFLNPNAIGTGVDCRTGTTLPGDSACGASNTTANGTGGTITTPWLTANFKDKVGHSLRTSEFFEGGINLTSLDLDGACFSSFLGDTRSSTSLTATLFDFAGGTTGSCGSGITTTPQAGDGGAIPATIGTDARVDVRDHADITVSGADGAFGGTVKFFLCGPLALDSESNCSTGGVQIGTPAAGETVTGNAGTASVNSDTATLTSAGRYCWRAEYSGDASVGIPASIDPADTTNVSECFSIDPEQPTLTTSAGADVVLGNPVEDTATLTGTAKQPGTDGVGADGSINATAGTQANAGGTITFSLVGPDDCVSVPAGFTDIDVTVDGDSDADTEYTASFTPTAIGEYTWVASYDGDSPNTLGASNGCPDADEEVVVGGTSGISTAQDWLPNDTATLTGDTNLSGTLTFQLYTGDNCGATSGTAVSGQEYIVNVDNALSGSEFSTSNTTSFLEADSGTYSWKVTYDDDNLEDPAPSCETTILTIDDTP